MTGSLSGSARRNPRSLPASKRRRPNDDDCPRLDRLGWENLLR